MAHDKFWEFVEAREAVRWAKEHSHPHPLTDDPRLARYWFPNIRRMDDPTTVWLHGAVLNQIKDPAKMVLAAVTFRLFNKVATGELILPMLLNHGYDSRMMLAALGPHSGDLFTGSLPVPMTGRNLGETTRILDGLQASGLVLAQLRNNSLQMATEALSGVRGIKALAYEIVVDLSHTSALSGALDRRTWSCPTPAAVHGAGEVLEEDLSSTRQGDREITIHLMSELLHEDRPISVGWEMAEVHRALCLYFTWARKAQPTRRYRR